MAWDFPSESQSASFFRKATLGFPSWSGSAHGWCAQTTQPGKEDGVHVNLCPSRFNPQGRVLSRLHRHEQSNLSKMAYHLVVHGMSKVLRLD